MLKCSRNLKRFKPNNDNNKCRKSYAADYHGNNTCTEKDLSVKYDISLNFPFLFFMIYLFFIFFVIIVVVIFAWLFMFIRMAVAFAVVFALWHSAENDPFKINLGIAGLLLNNETIQTIWIPVYLHHSKGLATRWINSYHISLQRPLTTFLYYDSLVVINSPVLCPIYLVFRSPFVNERQVNIKLVED